MSSKNVLITGVSSGIGEATALYLADKGLHVIGTSRFMTRLLDLQEEVSNKNLLATFVELNINSDESVNETLPRVIEEHGNIDVLINNAGFGLWGPVENLKMKEIKDQFETNFFASIRLIKAVLPGMIEQGEGTIINISSVEGRLATPFSGAYAASKFALEGLSEALRLELWPLGIKVAVVEPGLISTQFHRNQVIGEKVETGNSPYSPFINRYRAKRSHFDKFSSNPYVVAKSIHKIIHSSRPSFRHPVGLDSRIGTFAHRILPERIWQTLLSRATLK